jgi:glycosyltransferase involved in cell wall biosynthesis
VTQVAPARANAAVDTALFAAAIPIYNEEAAIAAVVAGVRQHIPRVVVVDDGSTDDSAGLAAAAGAEVRIHARNLGKGVGLRTALTWAREHPEVTALVLIDGDGQHDPAELDAIIAPVARGEADVVIGSRFLGLGQYRAPVVRRIGMAVFARFVSAVVRQPLSDTSSSFRAVNRRAMKLFAHEYPHGYLETVEATVMASKYGLRMMEVPVLMRERMFGRSSLTVPLATFYAFKVFVAVFVSLFRRTTLHLEEDA